MKPSWMRYKYPDGDWTFYIEPLSADVTPDLLKKALAETVERLKQKKPKFKCTPVILPSPYTQAQATADNRTLWAPHLASLYNVWMDNAQVQLLNPKPNLTFPTAATAKAGDQKTGDKILWPGGTYTNDPKAEHYDFTAIEQQINSFITVGSIGKVAGKRNKDGQPKEAQLMGCSATDVS